MYCEFKQSELIKLNIMIFALFGIIAILLVFIVFSAASRSERTNKFIWPFALCFVFLLVFLGYLAS